MHRIWLRSALALFSLGAMPACRDAASPVAPTGSGSDGPLYAAASPRVVPTGKGIGIRTTFSIGQRTKYRIEYHGGFVQSAPLTVYFIFYGNWPADSPTPPILTDFVLSLGGSNYWKINTLYTDTQGNTPSTVLRWASNVHDAYSHGVTLSDADVAGVVNGVILAGLMPHDPQGLYVVVPSPDVGMSGLGTTWCAFHQQTTLAGVPLAYAFIGHPARNPEQCAPQLTGPNGDFATDAMTSLLAAMLSNTVTDFSLNGWYDRLGLEAADKCAWTYGTTYQTPNGGLANVRLGGKDYLLQRLWVPAKGKAGYCALEAPGS